MEGNEAVNRAALSVMFPDGTTAVVGAEDFAELDALLNIDGGHRHEEQAIAKCARPSVLDGLKRPAQPGPDKKTSKAVGQEL